MDFNNNKNLNLSLLYERLSKNQLTVEEIENLNQVDECGITLILLASIYGNLELIKKLLKRDNEIIYTDCYNRLGSSTDPLHMAVKFEHTDLVQYLIEERRVYLNVSDSYSCTPLYYSISNGNCDLFSYLIDNGAKIDLVKGNRFKLAVNSTNVEIINLILPHLNEEDISNYCPFVDLIYSYCYPLDLRKKLKMFDYLLKHPAIELKPKETINLNGINDVVKMNKFRHLKLMIINNLDIDRLELDHLLTKYLKDIDYCRKLLAFLKLSYYLGVRFLNTNLNDRSSVQTIEKSNNYNTFNPFFGKVQVELNNLSLIENNGSDNELIALHQTDVFQSFLDWKCKKPKLLNLQQLSRIALRKHYNKNLIHLLKLIAYPKFLREYLNLNDLEDYLDEFDS